MYIFNLPLELWYSCRVPMFPGFPARVDGDLYRGRLGEIVCPILVILGRQDEHTPISEMEQLARRIPNARRSVCPRGDHGVHDADLTRDACTQEAREFVGLLS